MVAQNQHSSSLDSLIAELAALWGVQTEYRDAGGIRRESPRGAVMQVLGALSEGTEAGPWTGTDAREPGGRREERWLQSALEEKKRVLRGQLVEPVLVAWDGLLPTLGPRLSAGGQPDRLRRDCSVRSPKRAQLVLLLEGGGEARWEARWDESRAAWRRSVSGTQSGARIPLGYHRLQLEVAGRATETKVISAPRRCWIPEEVSGRWGLFAPLYALRSERNWGAGDLADMEELVGVVAAAGGDAVATLPLLAGYLDRPFEPAPYTPVSRLFWNEFYLAIEQIDEWRSCAPARAVRDSGNAQELIARWRTEPLVDYAGVMALKRRALEELSGCFFRDSGSERKRAFAAHLRAHPDSLAYADFRARVEDAGADWRDWPEGEQRSTWRPREPEQLSEAGHYHLYCQWQMEEQLSRLSLGALTTMSGKRGGALAAHEAGDARGDTTTARHASAGLFLDLPVGIHAGGFDTWRWRNLFVRGMSIGAPPDSFFTRGQRWDSPPLHPLRIREQGHSYYVGCLQQHMRHAGYLRVDHIMSLHRLFWVPEGRGAGEGVYVAYPAEELYAALCLESHRNRTVVVGEDLGTVPAGVRASMRRHGVLGTWVLQSAAKPRAARAVRPVPRHVVAGLGTHDMFPFAGFVRGDDIGVRVETGQLDREAALRATAARRRLVARLFALFSVRSASEAPAELLRAALAFLGASQAAFVLVSLDDLLVQTEPQNLPGTGAERGNWRRKTAGTMPEVERVIAEAVRGLRARQGGSCCSD